MTLAYLGLSLISFMGIWLGAGITVKSVAKVATSFKVSTFAFSFFVLGELTSIPELAVGLNAIAAGEPEIFVGNLLGGISVIFLLVIPLLAVTGKKINLNHTLRRKDLLTTLAIVISPSLLVLDRRISNEEAAMLMMLFAALFYIVPSRPAKVRNLKKMFDVARQNFVFSDGLRLLFGVGLVYISSHYIVGSTHYFAGVLAVSPFIISLLGLSIGTNLPELVLGVRSVLTGNKDVAFGDYLGSASYNVLLFGFLSLVNNGEVLTGTSFLPTFGFIGLGVGMFFWLTHRDSTLSRKEGSILLGLYCLFVIVELVYS